jgi:dimeric dUTPase (all-alpha-NTP-PPase superfamily)
MNIDLTRLYAQQAQLDAHIQQQHQQTYASTRQKRMLALLVELGEMINETKVFKFWSKKPPADKPIILDEYADGLHFYLSLGIEVQSKKMIYELTPPSSDIVEQTLLTFSSITGLQNNFTAAQLETSFMMYLQLIPLLGMTDEEVYQAYFKKLGVNYQRQQNHY